MVPAVGKAVEREVSSCPTGGSEDWLSILDLLDQHSAACCF